MKIQVERIYIEDALSVKCCGETDLMFRVERPIGNGFLLRMSCTECGSRMAFRIHSNGHIYPNDYEDDNGVLGFGNYLNAYCVKLLDSDGDTANACTMNHETSLKDQIK